MYHRGELEAQRRAGVQQQARRIEKIVGTVIPLAARDFLRRQPFAVLSSVDVQGHVWLSALAGVPGFMHAPDERSMVVNVTAAQYDALRENMQTNPSVGALVMEFATRRRMRVNGRGELHDNNIIVHAEQVYSNCPKYIQAREWEFLDVSPQAINATRDSVLTMPQQAWIRQADTFFIGSFHPQGGADASHRGGNPGFVKVLDEKTLLWPDYLGNNMFNTLGNLASYPQAGLLFIDFATGATLQLMGTAKVIWDLSHIKGFPGAQRLVQFSLVTVIEAKNALPLRWRFDNYSQFNPGT